ncbi:glutathione S-transferase [Pelagophyceae sp. CCMP2097]|nr:glutathione S-transferase [Pelagophyceae sp. CCMP2097]
MKELAPQSPDGAYMRPAPQSGSGAPPQLQEGEGRYVLFVGNACPWCHRTTLARALRGLEGAVRVETLDDDPAKASRGGWALRSPDASLCGGASDLKGVYNFFAKGPFQGRCTAPLLVDVFDGSIVSNESADILRAFALFRKAGNRVDLRPLKDAADIDKANDWIYELVNNAVYRCGFATSQQAYNEAEADVHAGLERADDALALHRFVAGEYVTEADVRLLPTIERFDACYATLFRCGRKTVRHDYANLQRWRTEMRSLAGVKETIDVDAATKSYFTSLFPLNPSGLVPVPPAADTPLGADETALQIDLEIVTAVFD